MENFNGTNEQEDRDKLYEYYCKYWSLRGLYSDELCGFKNQKDQSNFVATLEENRLPVDECMAAYYVLVYYKHFDPSDVKSALLAGCDPEELVKCETIFDVRTERYCDRISGTVGDIEVYDAASNGSRWDDSPYF